MYKLLINCSSMKVVQWNLILWSPTGLGESDLNGEVTVLQGVICTVEYNLGLNQGDCNWEVFLLLLLFETFL